MIAYRPSGYYGGGGDLEQFYCTIMIAVPLDAAVYLQCSCNMKTKAKCLNYVRVVL